MTRKHFVAIAEAIQAERVEASPYGGSIDVPTADRVNEALDTVARRLADVFAADNPRFDRERFLAACR